MDQQNVTIFEIIIASIIAIIAIYGALLSTMLYLRDKPCLKVKVSTGFYMGTMDPPLMLFIKAVNHGRRPVTIASPPLFVMADRTQLYYEQRSFSGPKKLDEGDFFHDQVELRDLCDAIKEYGRGSPYAVKITDTTGKVHLYKFKKKEWAKIESGLN